ncbi:MAG: F0F1 ATP synthase subunit A [Planctomycetota bacterium]
MTDTLFDPSLLSNLSHPVLAAGDLIDSVKPKYYETFGVKLLNSHILLMLLSAVLMLAIFLPMGRRYAGAASTEKPVPDGTSNFFEAIMLYLRDDVVRPILGDATNTYIPLLWTFFFFILFNNLIGLLPLEPLQRGLFGALGLDWYPVYGAATANIYVTGALALVAFIVIQYAGIKANGFGEYAKHFLAGAPVYMAPILVPVEIIGMFVKPVALAIRLMANMVGGKMLLLILTGLGVSAFEAMGAVGGTGVSLIVIIGSTAIMLLKVFVAFLQAYIFMFLTALFIGLLVVHDDHEEHDEEHAHDMDDTAELPEAAVQAGARMAG